MALKVEKGVPLPNPSRSGEYADTIATMKAEDSVRFSKEVDAKRFYQCLHYYNRGTPFGAAMRPEGDGFRVWRTAHKSKAGGRGKKGK